MTKPKKVTALLPAYQAADFIQASLNSLSAQTHPDFNVLVSVDLCEDDTYEVCQRHAEKDARFQVIRQSQRLGYVGNCNFLLDQADADYALFAFHDDVLDSEYTTKLGAVLDRRPEVVMCYSDVLLTEADGTQEHWAYTELEGLGDPVERGVRMAVMAGFWWVPNRGLFRLQEARRIGGLKTHGAGEFSADWPWLFHMSLLGEFVRVPETLCFKYYKPGSVSRSWNFSDRQWYEVGASCMRELWNSGLSGDEKLRVAIPLMSGLVKLQSRLIRESTDENRGGAEVFGGGPGRGDNVSRIRSRN